MKRTKEERFAAVRQRHLDDVSAYVRRRAPDDVVDDIVAETFLICWRRFDRVPDEPLPWLYAVARKTLANDRRKRARGGAEAAPVAFLEPQPSEDNGLAAVFATLSDRDREVLRLVAWEGLSLQDAAVALGCTAVSCRVRFHRAKKRLAERLASADAEDRGTRRPCTNSEGATP